MSTHKTVTPSVRYKLDNLRTNRQITKRMRIDEHLVPLVELIAGSQYARRTKVDSKTGLLAFKYADRRVMYWIGAEKLMIFGIGVNTYTVYDNFTADDFRTAMLANDPTTSFKL